MSGRRRGLPDYLSPGMRILFVGINPGLKSASMGHHFAGPSNRFWKLLYESRLVDEALTYQDDWRLPEWSIGLTNIIGRPTAGIDTLDAAEYRKGRRGLERKIARYRPHVVALLGVTMYRALFKDANGYSRAPVPGPTTMLLGNVPVYLLPNPSGRNAHYPYRQMLSAFHRLRQLTAP